MVDRQNRVGSKFGGGGVSSAQQSERERKERLRELALETMESPRNVRVQAVPDPAHQRGELPLAHAGEEAPGRPRPPRGDGGEAREAEGGNGRHDAD